MRPLAEPDSTSGYVIALSTMTNAVIRSGQIATGSTGLGHRRHRIQLAHQLRAAAAARPRRAGRRPAGRFRPDARSRRRASASRPCSVSTVNRPRASSGSGCPRDQAVALHPVHQPGQAASGQQHRLGQLRHPQPVARRLGQLDQHVVAAERDLVMGLQVLLQHAAAGGCGCAGSSRQAASRQSAGLQRKRTVRLGRCGAQRGGGAAATSPDIVVTPSTHVRSFRGNRQELRTPAAT